MKVVGNSTIGKRGCLSLIAVVVSEVGCSKIRRAWIICVGAPSPCQWRTSRGRFLEGPDTFHSTFHSKRGPERPLGILAAVDRCARGLDNSWYLYAHAWLHGALRLRLHRWYFIVALYTCTLFAIADWHGKLNYREVCCLMRLDWHPSPAAAAGDMQPRNSPGKSEKSES